MDVADRMIEIGQVAPEIRSGFVILIFISFDILFGLLQAVKNSNFESKIMRQGLFHKLGELLCYCFGVVCDTFLPMIDILLPFSLAGAITVYVVIMEIGSILENISKISPVMARYMGFLFEKLKPPDDVPDPGPEVSDAAER